MPSRYFFTCTETCPYNLHIIYILWYDSQFTTIFTKYIIVKYYRNFVSNFVEFNEKIFLKK